MNQMNFEVDFKGVSGKQEIIERLVKTFELPGYGENPWNWDSFLDRFTSLSADSAIVRRARPLPAEVHLTIKNIDFVKRCSEKEYTMLLEILEDSKDPEARGDGISFTYNIS